MDESLFIATTPGLEPVLLEEARALGEVRAEEGGVSVRAEPGTYARANLHLRTASRVWVRAGTFPVERLARNALAAYWDGKSPLSVRGAPGAQGLAAQVLRALGAKPAPEGVGDALSVLVRKAGAGVELSVDSSGELLHVRGHRQEVGRAPLRETLAAGVLLLAGYRPEAPLWDCMCGSGTLLLEAASLARGRAPGLERHFAFERWPSFRPAQFDALRTQARAAERPLGAFPLRGSDLNAGALGVARRNARRAGVFEQLLLERRDVATLRPPPELPPGLLVANLPYGKRVGERAELGALYAAVGRTAREAFAGWRYAFLLPEGPLGVSLGLTPEAMHRVSNGGIACELWVGGGARL